MKPLQSLILNLQNTYKMANYSTAFQRCLPNVTHATLANSIGRNTLLTVYPEMALAKDVSSLPNFNALKQAYKRVWAKMFGENIASQLVADFLFQLFLNNIEKAEKALIQWISQKTGLPISDGLTAEMINKLNGLIDNFPQFQEEITALLAASDVKLTWWQKAALWFSKIFLGK